jgi:hypothetical protein
MRYIDVANGDYFQTILGQIGDIGTAHAVGVPFSDEAGAVANQNTARGDQETRRQRDRETRRQRDLIVLLLLIIGR